MTKSWEERQPWAISERTASPVRNFQREPGLCRRKIAFSAAIAAMVVLCVHASCIMATVTQDESDAGSVPDHERVDAASRDALDSSQSINANEEPDAETAVESLGDLGDQSEKWERLSAAIRREEVASATRTEARDGATGHASDAKELLEAITAMYESALKDAEEVSAGQQEVFSTEHSQQATNDQSLEESRQSSSARDTQATSLKETKASPKEIAEEALASVQKALKSKDRSSTSASVQKLVEAHGVALHQVAEQDAHDVKLVVSLVVEQLDGVIDDDITVNLVDAHGRELERLEFFRGEDSGDHAVLFAVLSHQEVLRLVALRNNLFLVVSRVVSRLPREEKVVLARRVSELISISKLIELDQQIHEFLSRANEPWRSMVRLLEEEVLLDQGEQEDSNVVDEGVLDESAQFSSLEEARQWLEREDMLHRVRKSAALFNKDSSTSEWVDQRYDESANDGDGLREEMFSDGSDDLGDDEALELMELVEEALMDGRRTKEAVDLLKDGAERGDADAMATLAALLMSGDGEELQRDLDLGMAYARKAADEFGHPDAQASVALAHEFGMGHLVQQSDAHAVLLWTLAANGGSLLARMSLAFKFLHGLGVERACPAAAILYHHVATETLGLDVDETVDMEAAEIVRDEAADAVERRTLERRTRLKEEHLSSLTRVPTLRHTPPSRWSPRWHALNANSSRFSSSSVTQESEMVGYYQHVASTGNVNAMIAVGHAQLHGLNGIEPDEVAAREMFEAAADIGGAPAAHANLAFMHLKGMGGLPMDNKSAFSHYQKAAKMGDESGKNGLGYCYLNGIGVERNPEVAFNYFTSAANGGYDEAMYNLGVMYTQGLGTQQNLQQALAMFLKAAQKGHVHSMYHAAVLLYDSTTAATSASPFGSSSTGTAADCSRAVQLYKQVAELGQVSELVFAAEDAFWDGDYETALYRYLQSALAGVELAQYNAAFMLEEGVGLGAWFPTSTDAQRDAVGVAAARLYEMSSRQHYGPSYVKLGHLAFKQNRFKASLQAYETGMNFQGSLAESKFNVGLMYLLGRGVKQDDSLAKRYFDLAAKDHPDAWIPVFFALKLLRARYHVTRFLSWSGLNPWLAKFVTAKAAFFADRVENARGAFKSEPQSALSPSPSVSTASGSAEELLSEPGDEERDWMVRLGIDDTEFDIIVLVMILSALFVMLWVRVVKRRRRQRDVADRNANINAAPLNHNQRPPQAAPS